MKKSIPTILTTSQKLSTGVDARNVRNIVLLRPVNNIVEFKQIVGRGTRLFDDKNFFTIYDFVNASERFRDPEWDGEPIEPEETDPRPPKEYSEQEPEESFQYDDEGRADYEPKPKVKVRLANGKEHQITHSVTTTFFGPNGEPMTVQEFLDHLYGKIPELFSSEYELRKIWSNPVTRRTLLDKLEEAGFGKDELSNLQKVIDAEKCDIFDVLEYIAYSVKPITREARVQKVRSKIFALLNNNESEFIDFVLSKYIETGVEELDQEKLPDLLHLKYNAISDAAEALGGVENIRQKFIEFQKHLYEEKVA